MTTVASLPWSESNTAQEADPIPWLEATAGDPLVGAVMDTAAFRRLHDVAFLGALDYTQRLHLPTAQRSRASHSLEVAALANFVANGRGYPPELRRHLLLAALLHDIGHPPLSHSVDAAPRARSGHDHHEVGARIIRGELAIGAELHALLRRVADVGFILDLLDGKVGSASGGDLFASAMNIDTLDGIARALACLAPELPPLCRLASARASLLDTRRDAATLAILDSFWERKNLLYTQFIGQPLGQLADLACRRFLDGAAGVAPPDEEDFLAGESLWRRKYPELFAAFAELKRHYLPAWLDDAPFEVEFRGYFVDRERDFAERYRLVRGSQQTQASALLARLAPDAPLHLTGDAEYRAFLRDYPHIAQARRHSRGVLQALRSDLLEALRDSPQREHLCVVVSGSYGRDEACAESDLDWFILLDGCDAAQVAAEKAAIGAVIARHVARPTGDSGIFGGEATQDFAQLIEHIGGSQDSNQSLTRRMLLLLEGRCLFGATQFARLRRRLLEAYIGKGSPDKSISRFLLNDVIRYYRTITIDVQHKACVDRKSWGLRSIKLKFSRKLLYFAAIIAIADTAREQAREARIERMLALLELPALERLHRVAGASGPQQQSCVEVERRTRELFALYEGFLRQLAEPANRHELAAVGEDRREASELYMALRESSKTFTHGLLDWLQVKYAEEHPIHSALVF
ncbi:HD domain-containing protein [Pseudomonas oryzae]|uniref:HDIG domain-containing protein n=1 Tax=Pseudomonas oryzae TaxID=1392877 RepID=A0A1H1LPR1_9PSED|nr:HD domain-containing protein [Pseudomonas oryzae]SDR76558.1 HDIG domain-containing protein [Pseudomonas oryzae]